MIEDCKLKEKNRFVDDILKQVLIIIPNNEIMLITKLNEFYNSLNYKAPELRRSSDCWEPFINILNYFIPQIETDWQKEIREILINKILQNT